MRKDKAFGVIWKLVIYFEQSQVSTYLYVHLFFAIDFDNEKVHMTLQILSIIFCNFHTHTNAEIKNSDEIFIHF